MQKFYLAVALFAVLTSCSSHKGPKQEDFDKLEAELTDCKKLVDELSNTPQMRLANGQRFQSANDFENAKREFSELIKKYPGSNEAIQAEALIDKIEIFEKEQKDIEDRKKALGYKSLNEVKSIKIGDINVDFNSLSTSSQWIFDNYGTKYFYRSAERGDIYIIAKVSVSSDVKNPSLPPICAYKLIDGTLEIVGTLNYEFARWKDYGSYLGNYVDYGNDFAHTKTINFNCGLSVSQTLIDNEPVFVVVKKMNCFVRTNNSYRNPPVSYVEGSCGLKSKLSIDDFDEEYILVKIFNKTKLY